VNGKKPKYVTKSKIPQTLFILASCLAITTIFNANLLIVNRNGKWYASLVLEIDDTLLKNSRKTDNGVMAIDLGCNDAIAWTNGEKNGLVAAPRFFRSSEKKNQQLGKSKRRKRSPNFKKKVKASRRWKKVQKLVK
jgi:putative transposase